MNDKNKDARQVLNRLAEGGISVSAREKSSASRFEELVERENDFENYRLNTQNALVQREKELQREAAEREKVFTAREKNNADLRNKLHQQLMVAAENETRLKAEVAQRQEQLDHAIQALEEEKTLYKDEARRNIQQKSDTYVQKALAELKDKNDKFHTYSFGWGIVGAVAIAASLALVIVVSFLPQFALTNGSSVSWQYIVYSSLRGVVTIGVALAFARYAFLFSTQYMRESLRIADRRHAISFGAFYVESYGATADWAQVKEAFANWNISGADIQGSQVEQSKTASSEQIDISKKIETVYTDLKALLELAKLPK